MDPFEEAIREQIAINQARTPTQRFLALCDLLDDLRAMAPMDPESIERRRRVQAAKERKREQVRAYIRQLIAAHRAEHPQSV